MAFTFAMQSLGSEGRLERLIAERLQPGADEAYKLIYPPLPSAS